MLIFLAQTTIIGLNAQCTFSQLGVDINGEADDDRSGYSVSLSADGLSLAIGAPVNAGGGTQRGHVRIYKNISGTWTQQGADIEGETDSDQSGTSVSLSADGLIVAIGAHLNAGGGSVRGHVRVYKFASGTWTQVGADIDGEADGDLSGRTLSISANGNIVAIGGVFNAGGGSNRGHVRVYENISGTWTQIGSDINGVADYDGLGFSISLSANGSKVAIGAPFNAGGGIYRGQVQVFKNSSGTWYQEGLDINGEMNNDNSGEFLSLSADGSTLAIGSRYNSGNGSNSGHVRVYKYNNSSAWIKQGEDIDGEMANDRSGFSISLSSDGSVVAIGATRNAGGGTRRGHVRVYKIAGNNWIKLGPDLDGEANYDESGYSVSLSSNGNTVAIGAIYNDGGGIDRGHVKVFQLNCPEINIKGNSVSITDGDLYPSSIDSTNFGAVAYGTKRRFTIENTGSVSLGISSITLSGMHASDFAISGVPTNIAAGDSASFTVSFATLSPSTRNAIININSNDPNEAAYDFAITARDVNYLCSISQLGIDIDGEANGDYSGESVSLSSDGSIVAIGATGNNGGGSDRGHVRVYKNVSGTWTQLGTDINGEANSDHSGESVSLSADGGTVAIGAPENYGTGSGSGHVRVYKYISGVWTKQGADINGESSGDNSGYSVSLSSNGNIVAIGGVRNDGIGGSLKGHVRVYELISSTWTQIGADIDGEANFDRFGHSVSLSSDGSTVAIGAPMNEGNGTRSGHVEVYKNISGTWIQLGVDIDGEEAWNRCGWSVSLSADGNILAIGAIDNYSEAGINGGHVRIYKYFSGTWTQLGADIDGEANDDLSGSSVSLSSDGSIVAIGARNNRADRGQVRLYKYITGTWTQQGPDIDGEAPNDHSGFSVSLSSDGSTVAIGGPWNIGGGGSNSIRGHVRVYKLNCPTCNLGSALPIAAGTYTATQLGYAGSYTCFCDTNDNLLLALDTIGTGAVIPASGVSLEIGSTKTTSWSNAGGIITNPNGGVIFNRKWDVTPTNQPSSPVKVKFFFTQADYDSVRTQLLPLGTTITSPTQFEMYKLFTNGFGDPHASGATGIVLMNGSTPSLNNWKYASFRNDHSAEFLVSSFSGGGGGAGLIPAIPLSAEFINFNAKSLSKTSALLKWQMASEVNTSYFNVERSLDGVNFIKIGIVKATISNAGKYQYIDNTISIGTQKAFYRINQVDINGKNANTNIQLVNFGKINSNVLIYPNPMNTELNMELSLEQGEKANISFADIQGKIVFYRSVSTTKSTLDLSTLSNGVYTISIQKNGVVENFKIVKQ